MRRAMTAALATLVALATPLAACGTESGPAAAPAPTSAASTPSSPTVPSTSAPPTVPAPSTQGGIPGDGTFLVSRDIRPGTYRSAGAAPGTVPNCYWERDKDVSGTLDSVIANGNTTGPAVVQISSTDVAFKTSGCQPWALVSINAAPPTSVPTTQVPVHPTTQPGANAASVVEAYYAAINTHDYATAWNLGGHHFAATYGAFVAGYSNTRQDNLVVTSVSGDKVFITLTAYNLDGTTQYFTGYYTVDGGAITAAHIH